MNTDIPPSNPEFEFDNLEKKVNALLSLVERLQEENSTLKQGQEELLDERSQLLTKNEMTKKKVEEMITKLKSMGHGT
ncbi:MAG: TIGR02449 family protein [Methylococcales bacterium]